MRAVHRKESAHTPSGLRPARRLAPLSAEACRLGETARAAAGRRLCGPKAAAVSPACGKCHEAALRFVAEVTAVPRPPSPLNPLRPPGNSPPTQGVPHRDASAGTRPTAGCAGCAPESSRTWTHEKRLAVGKSSSPL